jgi:lysophospholipase L1-like esterase
MPSPLLRSDDHILFQGDSITDAGRGAPPGLGSGYVAMVRGLLRALRPELRVTITNRGVGGDRTAELLARWQRDCLDLKPDVLSIKIGVNDVWRLKGEWNGQRHIPLPEFRANYVRLLEQARSAGIQRLVLISPTTIDHENRSPCNDLLGEYAAATQALADQYGATYVPARDALLAARAAHPEVAWTTDGCHPTAAGHAVIAAAWVRAVAGVG